MWTINRQLHSNNVKMSISQHYMITVVRFTQADTKLIHTSRVRLPNGGRNEANSDIDTGYTNVVAVALAKTAANYFVILISM